MTRTSRLRVAALLTTAAAGLSLLPGTATAAPAAPEPRARAAAERVVNDPADARAAIDLRRVTYRVGPKAVSVTATATAVPPSGTLILDMANDGLDDSLTLYVEQKKGKAPFVYGELVYNEDVIVAVRCNRTARWNARTDVVGVAIDRPCLERFLRRSERPFTFDRLEMTAWSGTLNYARTDDVRTVVLRG